MVRKDYAEHTKHGGFHLKQHIVHLQKQIYLRMSGKIMKKHTIFENFT